MRTRSAFWGSIAMAMALAVTGASAQQGGGRQEQRGGPGFGGPPPGGLGLLFMNPLAAVVDTDYDGQLSIQEIAAAPKSILKLDANGDGVLDPQELRPDPFEFVKTHLMGLDASGNGKIERTELPQVMAGLMERLDRNQDMALDESELDSIGNMFGRRRGGRGGFGGPGGPAGRGGPPRPEAPRRPVPPTN